MAIHLIIFSFGLLVFLTGCQTNDVNHPPVNQIEAPIGQPSFFDGHSVGLGAADHKALAVVMDNFFASRPPSGINSAAVVYEVPVESNISRFLAIFSSDNLLDKIGTNSISLSTIS